MLDYKRILTLHYVNGLTGVEIAKSVCSSKTTVNEFLKRFRESNALSFPLKDDVTNETIESLLYKKRGPELSAQYRDFDCEAIYKALSHKGETLKHLWRKYNAVGIVDDKIPCSYRQYCRKYSEWAETKKITFHIQRYPGVNLELDFAGKVLYLANKYGNEPGSKVTIFIATLSYSDYFYCEGLTKCDIKNWIRVNNNALKYFGGVTQIVTPDNCKVAVTENKNWIDPILNKDFQAWAEYYGTALMPAKVKSPQWKPNVENSVKLVTMHILTDMAEMKFFTLEELNKELWRRMDKENETNFQGLSFSRWDKYVQEEKDTLLNLPQNQYEYLERQQVKVGQDFSFTFDHVHYTMPKKYIKSTLEVRASFTAVHVYNLNGDKIRTHKRSYTPNSWVVEPSDMPQKYSDYAQWSIPFFQSWASEIGVNTRFVIDKMLGSVRYPVQAFRKCRGVLGFSQRYSKKMLEQCCTDAVLYGKCNYTYIKNTIPEYEEQVQKTTHAEDVENVSQDAITGVFKADDSQYSLENLLKKQEKEVF